MTLTRNLQQGRKTAQRASAAGFGECSARTGENVREAWQGIVDFVVVGLEGKRRGQRREKARDAVKGVGVTFVDAFCGFPSPRSSV